jgi:hypothetical protein
MTVCVGVAVNDCLVFAADSASSIVQTQEVDGQQQSRILNVYQNGDKVYNLFKGLPIAAMTCGMGNIGSESIGTLAKRFRKMLVNDPVYKIDPERYELEDVALKVRQFFFEERYQALENPPQNSSFEFWVGGYSSGLDARHEVWKISIVNGACGDPTPVVENGDFDLFWGGQPGPIHRLLFGFDPELLDVLREMGAEEEAVGEIADACRARLTRQIVLPTMPVRDAIALADYLVATTKDFFRFLPGADIVGGETDIAVVTRYEGFKWIRRKHFYPAHLNPLETGHA